MPASTGVTALIFVPLLAGLGLTAGYYLLRSVVWQSVTVPAIRLACGKQTSCADTFYSEQMILLNERWHHPPCIPLCCLGVSCVGVLLVLAPAWNLSPPAALYVYEAVAVAGLAAFSAMDFLEFAVVLDTGLRLRAWCTGFRTVTIPYAEITSVRLRDRASGARIAVLTAHRSFTLGVGLNAVALFNMLSAQLRRHGNAPERPLRRQRSCRPTPAHPAKGG